VLITDGAVGNEDEVISLIDRRIGDSRLFTVGIGSVPNDLLMTRAARAGRGAHTFIGDIEEVGERMNELFAKLENPVLTDLRITWPGRDPEYFPNPVPDLFAGEPVVVAARLDGPGGIAHLSGRLGGNIWRQDIAVPAGAGNPGVAAIWARAKIRRFNEQMRAGAAPDAVRLAITDVALDHRMLSKYTSLIAVDPMPARPADEDLHRSAIATNLPHGWTHEGVFGEKALERRAFLRSPAGTPIVLAASGIAAAPMPQTATAAEIHLLWALFLFGLAGMAYFAFRPWRRR
jgi:Ca-activated chloride channel family protein